MTTTDIPVVGQELRFQVDARHVRQLGQQLVGDKVTALVELVKNAYDADAETVTLTFDLSARAWVAEDGSVYTSWSAIPQALRNRTDGSLVMLDGLLTIDDDGSGMTLEDVANSWMRIASAEKEENATSPRFGRARAGRKGIGRFSAESLGRHLTLRTTAEGSNSLTSVWFDWERDYRAGIDLSDVLNVYRQDSIARNVHGTRLEIRGLHERWTPTQRRRVARSLLFLQPPFVQQGNETKPDFRVNYVVDGTVGEVPDITHFLKNGTARIEGIVHNDGSVELRVESTLLNFQRSEILPEKALIAGTFRLSGSYFVYRKDAIGVPLRDASQLAAEFGGVRVYRDGLRLLPYGERHDDWLGLDESSRRREYLNPIGNQNFFVEALITRDGNPFLEDMSSREGLLNNEAYEEFKAVIRSMLLAATSWVAEHRQRKAKGGSTQRKKEDGPRLDRQQGVRDTVDSIMRRLRETLSQEAVSQVEAAIASDVELRIESAAEEDADEQQQIVELQSEVELLRVLSSLGTSISIFSHEIRTVVNATRRQLNERGLPLQNLDALAEIAKYIDGFTADSRRRERTNVPFGFLIESFVKQFAKILTPHIEIEWSVTPPSLRSAPMSATAVQAILINLFTNAAKAVDVENLPSKKIRISASVADQRLVRLRVEDTGLGVPGHIRDRMFDAFVTGTASASHELGIGTGLGLKIVSDLAEEYGGYALLAGAEEGYSTAVDVYLPRWEKQVADNV